MALSDQEKERIIEEEKVRAEARAQHGGDCCGGGGCCGGHGHYRRGGFLKGLLVGALAFWAVSALCRHHCGGMGMYGHGCAMAPGCYGAPMAPAAPAAPNPKSKSS